jgi:hypothetical protein
VITSATGLMDPGHPGPPRTIALVPLPCEQMPDHAASQLDERRCPRRLIPRHEPSMRSCVRYVCLNLAIGAPFSLRHAPVTPCLQSMAKMSSTVHGLAWSVPSVHLRTATSRLAGVSCGCHRGSLKSTGTCCPVLQALRQPGVHLADAVQERQVPVVVEQPGRAVGVDRGRAGGQGDGGETARPKERIFISTGLRSIAGL